MPSGDDKRMCKSAIDDDATLTRDDVLFRSLHGACRRSAAFAIDDDDDETFIVPSSSHPLLEQSMRVVVPRHTIDKPKIQSSMERCQVMTTSAEKRPLLPTGALSASFVERRSSSKNGDRRSTLADEQLEQLLALLRASPPSLVGAECDDYFGGDTSMGLTQVELDRLQAFHEEMSEFVGEMVPNDAGEGVVDYRTPGI